MKKTRIISAVLSLLLLFNLFINSSASSLEIETCLNQTNYSSQTTEHAEDDNICCLESPDSNAYLSNEKFFFEPNELIILEFKVKTEGKIVDYAIEAGGVSASESTLKGSNSNYAFCISFPLLQASADEHLATFSITFNLSTEESLTNTVYIFKGSDGCAISSSAHSTAKRLYYANMYKKSKITKEEYDDTIALDYASCLTSSSEVSHSLLYKLAKRAEDKSASNDIIAGELYWKDKGDQSHPLRGVKVELYSTSNLNTVLETVYTDYDGAYIFSSYNLTANNRQVKIKVYAGDDNVDVYDYTNNQPFCLTIGPFNTNYSAETILETQRFDMLSNFGHALQIFQAAMTARDFAWNMMGGGTQDVNIYYPTQGNNCYYDPSTKKILITANAAVHSNSSYLKSYESWDVVMHEYGHHIQSHFDINARIGGTHSSANNNADVYGPYKGTRLAWGESWPTVFAMQAQEYFWYYLKDLCYYSPSCPLPGTPEAENHICFAENTIYEAYNFSYSSYYNIETTPVAKGEACERSIMAILWDIYDYTFEANDEFGVGTYAYWNITTSFGAKTFSEFMEDFYFACNNPNNTDFSEEYIDKIAPNLVKYKMSAEIIEKSGAIPTFTIKPNGGGESFYNNNFILIYYDASGNLISTSPVITSFEYDFNYQINSENWDAILSATGTTYSVRIASYANHYDENAPVDYQEEITGPYYSPLYTYSK